MKKKYIQLGAAALALIALVAALMLLRREPAEVAEAETPAAETIYIYGDAETENTTPKQLDIHNEFSDMIIDNITPEGALPANVELTIRGWENLSLDTYSLGQAASNAKSMRAKDIISENATTEELKTFGLDSPRAKLTVHLQNGDKPVVLFGANAPGGEGVYAKTETGNTIYLITDGMAVPYFKPAAAYVNKTITGTDPEFVGFNKITLSGTDYPEPLVIERTPETEVSGAGITLHTHSFTSPIKRSVDGQRGLEPLSYVYGLLGNNVLAVDDSEETLEKYGLNNPAAIVAVEGDTDEMTFTLRISAPAENGEVRLIKDGSKVIYELSPSALPFLGKTMFDMMDKMVLVPNITTVDRVLLISEVGTYDFVLTQEDEGRKLDVTANGVPIPDTVDENGKAVTGGENFRKLYQTMIAARYDEPIPKMIDSETGEVFLYQADAAQADSAEGEPGATDASDEAGMFKLLETEESGTELGAVEAIEAAMPTDELGSSPYIVSIEYFYNDGRDSDVVTFYGGPPRKVEIALNGESGYYGQSVYVDRLLEDVEKVVNGIAVKTYL